MKNWMLFILFIILSITVYSQTVPVTFHFKPPDNVSFTKLRVVGSFNNWNNADPAMEMTGPNSLGEYEITTSLAANTDHNYKFCMDGNWGYAYGDQDNPRINASDNNNSQLMVKNPMITYLLPRDVNTKGEQFVDNTVAGLPIRAVFAFTADKPLDAAKITLTIDGAAVSNPAQYYNAAKRELTYKPPVDLAKGEHTVVVSITSAAGTDQATSKFTRNPDFVVYKVPVDFYYDQNNKLTNFMQTITSVSAVGAFNNWNDALNMLQDNDGDGLWETTAKIDPGSSEYKFKLNKTTWVNDPDNIQFGESADNNNLIVAKVDSMATLKLVEPQENKTFSKDTIVSFKVLLRPGVKSKGVDAATVKIKLDDKDVASSFDAGTSVASANIVLIGNGRHVVSITYKNIEGVSASKTFAYGINTAPKGIYAVDGSNDEQFKYPSGITEGSADILYASITETEKHDSLKFSIKVRALDKRTRIGLLITNPVNNMIDAPKQLGIKIPDFTGQGVFASIGFPEISAINFATENRFMVSANPVVYDKRQIEVLSTAWQTYNGLIEFKVSLQFLDSIMGNWKQERMIGIVSFLSNPDKSGNAYKPSISEGGSTAAEIPNIYDAAFMRSSFWQNRLLTSYIPAGQKNGPKMFAADGAGRGFLSVTATQISDSLAHFGTDITFLTPGVEYWYPTVVVHGQLSDTTIRNITFVFNDTAKVYTIYNGYFMIPVNLKEGKNVAYVMATDSKGYKSVSKDLILSYKKDKMPTIMLDGTASKRQVTMTATASSPIGSNLAYFWAPGEGNPAVIDINSTSPTAVFSVPQVDGEYTIASGVMDDFGNFTFAKKIVVSSGDSVYVADDNYHAKWVDNAIFYEIYPRSFSSQGGFQGITDKVDQIKELGVNAIWLMPIFKGPTVHGYEITDYYALEEDYGTEQQFKTMLSVLHANGIKVILDYVVNHTGVTHPFMQNVFQYKKYSPWANFYLWDGEPGNSNFKYYFDWSSLPNLNHNDSDVRKYFIEVAKYWMRNFEIDGFRCDVAWGVQERNTQFWRDWRKELKNINPQCFLEAEASSSDLTFYDKRFDSANDWDLRNKVIGALNGSVTLSDLHKEATRSYPAYARPFRFMENHDETRATAMFDAKRSLMTHTLMFTLNGVPLIYSGGEVGELTNRGMIKWTDPNNMKPYFKRLIEIRKSYIHNPKVDIVNNNNPNSIYSYSSISGSNVIVTVANFKENNTTVVIDLSKTPVTLKKDMYLTDLFSGKVYKIPDTGINNVPLPIDGYQARVFYYGSDSVKVITAVNNELANNAVPGSYKLFQNYPNPFNPTSVIKYQTVKAGLVTLKVYDILGREVATLVNEVKAAGIHECIFNGSGLSSGVYIYQLKAGDFISAKKFTLMK